MKIRKLYLGITIVSAALVLSPLVADAQSITLESKKLTCEEDHLALTTSMTNSRDIALKLKEGVLLRGENERCLQGIQHELELKPGESRSLQFTFDKVPCVAGKYRTDHKVVHNYVSRMVALGKFDELFRQSSLDGIPKKYQNLFQNFDAEAKEKLIRVVRSGDFQSRLMAEFNSFMLECP